MIGVVITFDDAENKAWITVSEPNLDQFIGHDASFQFSKTKGLFFFTAANLGFYA
jgi:hypothetical protein